MNHYSHCLGYGIVGFLGAYVFTHFLAKLAHSIDSSINVHDSTIYNGAWLVGIAVFLITI